MLDQGPPSLLNQKDDRPMRQRKMPVEVCMNQSALDAGPGPLFGSWEVRHHTELKMIKLAEISGAVDAGLPA